MAHALSESNYDQIRSQYADVLNDWISGPEEEKQETEIFNFCSQCIDNMNNCLITKHCLSLVLRFAAGLILARHNGELGPVIDLVIDEGDLLKECLDAFNEKIVAVKSSFEESQSQIIFQDDIQIDKGEVAISESDKKETEGLEYYSEAGLTSEDLNASKQVEEQEHFEVWDTRPADDLLATDLPKKRLNELNEKVVSLENSFERSLRQSTNREDNQNDNEHEAVLNSDENEFEGFDSLSRADKNLVELNTSTNKTRRGKEHRSKVRKCFLKDGVKYKQCSLAGCNEDYEVGNRAAYAKHERKFHRYACDLCGRVLYSRNSLFDHIRLHDGEKAKVKCDFCERTFTTKGRMMTHVREIHDNSGIHFECQYCGIGFMIQKDLLAHLDTHTECEYCDEKLPDRVTWINHNRSEHSDKLYTCDQCDHISLSLKLLDRHKRMTHYKDKNEDRYTVYPIKNASFYQCPLCSLQFTTKEFVLQHNVQIHTNPQSGTLEQSSIKRRTKEERKYGCDICGKMYLTKTSLWSHKYKEHNTPKQTCICDVCGQTFKRESFLKAHMANKHTTEQPFRCEHCPRAFSQACLLKKHARTHFAEKIHVCQHCDYRSKQLNTLKEHITRKHTTDRPFECPKCDKGFVNKYDLGRHLPMHSTAKPYQCELCEQTFRRKLDVLRHLSKVHADKKGIEWHPVRNPTADKTEELSSSSSR